jgi:hypothetical protein
MPLPSFALHLFFVSVAVVFILPMRNIPVDPTVIAFVAVLSFIKMVVVGPSTSVLSINRPCERVLDVVLFVIKKFIGPGVPAVGAKCTPVLA